MCHICNYRYRGVDGPDARLEVVHGSAIKRVLRTCSSERDGYIFFPL